MSEYPALAHLPDDERAAWIERAERGEALTADEQTALGFAASLRGLVLLPTGAWKPAQVQRVFAGDRAALRDVMQVIVS